MNLNFLSWQIYSAPLRLGNSPGRFSFPGFIRILSRVHLFFNSTTIRESARFLRLFLTARLPSPLRISGTSRCFFELSGATNSTIGSYQIDYVNFRPNRATEWDSTPKRCSRASSLDAPLLGEGTT